MAQPCIQRRDRRGLLLAALLAGCSPSGHDSHSPPRSNPVVAANPAPSPAPAAAPVLPSSEPPAGHLDDPDASHPPASTSPVRQSHPIDIILRSTPSGAQVAVDGLVIGDTPAYWNGQADGHEHEFTFVLARHAIARYRFVPITSGTIHARMQPISEDVDAGVPPPEVVPPSPPAAPQGPLP